MEDKGVRFGQVSNVFMQLGVNEVDKEGVRKGDGQQVVRVVRMEVWMAGESIESGQKVA